MSGQKHAVLRKLIVILLFFLIIITLLLLIFAVTFSGAFIRLGFKSMIDHAFKTYSAEQLDIDDLRNDFDEKDQEEEYDVYDIIKFKVRYEEIRDLNDKELFLFMFDRMYYEVNVNGYESIKAKMKNETDIPDIKPDFDSIGDFFESIWDYFDDLFEGIEDIADEPELVILLFFTREFYMKMMILFVVFLLITAFFFFLLVKSSIKAGVYKAYCIALLMPSELLLIVFTAVRILIQIIGPGAGKEMGNEILLRLFEPGLNFSIIICAVSAAAGIFPLIYMKIKKTKLIKGETGESS